jgi:hypothetical protein
MPLTARVRASNALSPSRFVVGTDMMPPFARRAPRLEPALVASCILSGSAIILAVRFAYDQFVTGPGILLGGIPLAIIAHNLYYVYHLVFKLDSTRSQDDSWPSVPIFSNAERQRRYRFLAWVICWAFPSLHYMFMFALGLFETEKQSKRVVIAAWTIFSFQVVVGLIMWGQVMDMCYHEDRFSCSKAHEWRCKHCSLMHVNQEDAVAILRDDLSDPERTVKITLFTSTILCVFMISLSCGDFWKTDWVINPILIVMPNSIIFAHHLVFLLDLRASNSRRRNSIAWPLTPLFGRGDEKTSPYSFSVFNLASIMVVWWSILIPTLSGSHLPIGLRSIVTLVLWMLETVLLVAATFKAHRITKLERTAYCVQNNAHRWVCWRLGCKVKYVTQVSLVSMLSEPCVMSTSLPGYR